MLAQFNTVPNLLVGLRLVLVPVLWTLAFLDEPYYIGIGLIVAGATDALDGFLARRLNQVTEAGAHLDSIADNLVILSVLAWGFMLRREVYTENLPIVLAAIVLYAVMLAVAWLKFRRVANLHLYSAKVAAVAAYAFVIHAFMAEEYSRTFFYVAILLQIIAAAEALAVLVTQPHVHEHMGSILLASRRRARRPRAWETARQRRAE